MSFETLQRLLSYTPPNIPQYVGNHILNKESKMMLFGGPKMFKSLLAEQLGFCLASGTTWLGFSTVQCKVMYLQSEVSKGMFQLRTKQMARNVTVPVGQYLFDTSLSFKLNRKADADRLERDIIKEKPDVLILDPWYKMLTFEDNNNYSATQDIMDALIEKHKISIVMIHHDTVPPLDLQTGKPITRFHPRGPRTTEGWFDAIIQVDGDIQTDKRILSFELRHALHLVTPVEIELDRGALWSNPVP
jgi:RecA-family ATPase